jgi:hypothetical protein
MPIIVTKWKSSYNLSIEERFRHLLRQIRGITDLRVPENIENELPTALFEKYQQNIGINDLVVSMNSKPCAKKQNTIYV